MGKEIIINTLSGCVSEKQPVDYVNPFIGTQPTTERVSTDGWTHPGAWFPFGMTKWIPANIDNQSDPYKYVEDSGRMRLYPEIIKEQIFSFRGSHYPNGSHTRDYGSYDFMPITGDLKFTTEERASRISHDREVASPGYYSVYLEDYKTNAEITATERYRTQKAHGYFIIDQAFPDPYPDPKRLTGAEAIFPQNRTALIQGFPEIFRKINFN